ncbi:MAG: hypothetical protein KAR42_15975 [candidate division Zixibacteria bacterium]|nr:hypothetical protein [candidate division Zixibacteria bacterium]
MCTKHGDRSWGWKSLLVLITLLFCVTINIQAGDISSQLKIPDTGISQMISLQDGSTLVGRIKEIKDNEIIFEAKHGDLTIPIDQIIEIKEISDDDIKGGKYWFPNPNQTRLYFGPTGRMLKKGEGYFSDVYLFFPSVTYGVSDNFSISGGISIFPTDDFGEQLIYVTPKIGFKANENLSIAGSAIIVRVPDWFGDDDDINNDGEDDIADIVGILFATATYGNEDNSLTFGLGFGYADDEVSSNPAIQVGGEYRMSRRMSFVTENWVFPEMDDPMISYGFRFFGETMAVDLALFNVLNDDAFFPGLPYIDFVYNF